MLQPHPGQGGGPQGQMVLPTRFYLDDREVTGIRVVTFNEVDEVTVDDYDNPIRGLITYLPMDIPSRKFWQDIMVEQDDRQRGWSLRCEPPEIFGPPVTVEGVWFQSAGYVIQHGAPPLMQVRFKAAAINDLVDTEEEKEATIDIIARLQGIWPDVQKRVGEMEANFVEVAPHLKLAGEVNRELVITLPRHYGGKKETFILFEELQKVVSWAIEEAYGYRFRVHVFLEEDVIDGMRGLAAQKSEKAS